MNKKIEKVIVFAIIILASALLFIFAFYRYEFTGIFYYIIWAISILTAAFSLLANHNRRFSWLFVLIYVFMVLRALDPLSTPSNVFTNQPDANYHYQIVQKIDENNHLIFSENDYSGQAKGYYGYPMLEIILLTIAKVSGLNIDILVKYFGFALGFAALLFVVCYYKRKLGIRRNQQILILSVLLFASCPWFIGFTARTVDLSLSFPLFILTLSMLLPTRKATLIVFLLLLSTVLAHHFMGFLLIAYITAYMIARYVIRGPSDVRSKKLLTRNHLLFASAVAFFWAITISPQTAKSISSFSIDMLRHVFLTPWVFEAERFTVPIGGKPAWMIIVQAIGYVSFLGFGLLGLMWPILKKAFKKSQLVHQRINADTFALLITAAILALPYWLGFGRSIDLMWRSLLFIFLALAPFTAKSLTTVNNRIKKVGFFRFPGKILVIVLLAFIIQNSVYNGLSFYYYDPSAKTQPEDPRLNLQQWVSIAEFTKKYVSDDFVYGVRLAYNFVGSLAKKNVIQLVGDPVVPGGYIIEPSMLANDEVNPSQIFILRKSLVTVPDPKNYTLSPEQIDALLNNFNMVYQSDDAMIIISTVRAHAT